MIRRVMRWKPYHGLISRIMMKLRLWLFIQAYNIKYRFKDGMRSRERTTNCGEFCFYTDTSNTRYPLGWSEYVCTEESPRQRTYPRRALEPNRLRPRCLSHVLARYSSRRVLPRYSRTWDNLSRQSMKLNVLLMETKHLMDRSPFSEVSCWVTCPGFIYESFSYTIDSYRYGE